MGISAFRDLFLRAADYHGKLGMKSRTKLWDSNNEQIYMCQNLKCNLVYVCILCFVNLGFWDEISYFNISILLKTPSIKIAYDLTSSWENCWKQKHVIGHNSGAYVKSSSLLVNRVRRSHHVCVASITW